MMFIVDPCGAWSLAPNDASLETLQAHVGGLIQYVPMPKDCPFEIIVNEEGLLHGMEHNVIASALAKHLWLSKHDKKDLILDMLNVVGPAVIVMKEAK